MTLQPDDGERDDRLGDHRPEEVAQPGGTPVGTAVGADCEMTVEPWWVLAAIVLGLAALAGSVLMIVVAAIGALVVWLANAPHPDGSQSLRDPFGGPLDDPR